MVDVPLWMGTVGDTVDAVELRNGCVSDLSPPGRLQQNIVYIKKVQNEKFPIVQCAQLPGRQIDPCMWVDAHQNGEEEGGHQTGHRHQTQTQQSTTTNALNGTHVVPIHILFVQHFRQAHQFFATFAQFTVDWFDGTAECYLWEYIMRLPIEWVKKKKTIRIQRSSVVLLIARKFCYFETSWNASRARSMLSRDSFKRRMNRLRKLPQLK